MSNITITDISNLIGVDLTGVNFEFTTISPLELNPNAPFPPEAFKNGEISLVSFKAQANKDFSIKGAKDIKFGFNAGGQAAFGVYRNTEKIIKVLTDAELSEQLRNLLNLKIEAGENLLAILWGYNFGASAEGKIGLFSSANPVKLDFGIKANMVGKSVLLHSVKDDRTVVQSIKETLETWKTPYQVESPDSLKPKTTVIFETLGNLDLSLGVEYGYNYNWARDAVKLGGLSGEVGLKIEAGIKAQFGFTAVGNYALALTRESSAQTIRAQVFKMKQNGWSFALDGGIGGQYTGNIIPEKLDDFVKGVFNLNGLQVLKDFEKWTDPNTKIEDLLGAELEKYAKELIKKVTGIDPDESLTKLKDAVGKLKSLIKKWHELPHEINSYLYGLLSSATDEAGLDDDLDKIRRFLQQVVSFKNNPAELSSVIEEQLRDIDFFTTPVGKWLSAASQEGIVSLLANIQSKTDIITAPAEKTLALLDGDEVQKQLKRLQKEIDEKLNLGVIEKLDPQQWNDWLIQRLKDFLGVKQISDELEKIKTAINKTRKKAEEFYAKGYEALKKKYSFDFEYAFQKTTGKSALIDATLDFSGNKQADAKKYLAQILRGDFKEVLTETNDCLKLNQAVLTHEIKRNTHLGISVPYFTTTLDHITNSVAKGKFVEAADGRLWAYTVNAEDIVAKKKSVSRLAINVELFEKSGIRQFGEGDNRIDYSFQFGGREIRRKYIEQRYKFSADRYLKSAFPAGSTDFSAYMAETDKLLDKNGYPKPDEFGTVLMNLKVSMPGKIMSAWEQFPDTDDFYKKVSETIQTKLREWIPLNYIQGSEQYKNTRDMFPLLAYASLSLKTEKKLKDGAFYWEYRNAAKKKAEFTTLEFQTKMRKRLADARELTDDSRYKDSNLSTILNFVLTDQNNGQKSFHDLCDIEEDIIKGVVETAKAYHSFKKESNPEKKVAALAEFGKAFTDTFNAEFSLHEITQTPYTPKDSLRPLGMTLFLEMVKLVTPEFDDTKFAAMLEMFVLEPDLSDKDFKKLREQFLKGEFDETGKKFVLRQRIVNVDSPAV